ncbi:uncharacterized protein LOC114459050 [Gouania willdenowi]|uniref:uncharacterized protein LOC114459050 n=1 Tax=Gouania willdenowi TaxID=441366 RepID=UPI0010542D4D|nr:uncharacterized protein LOC114459050 [Gouania willdenowi]
MKLTLIHRRQLGNVTRSPMRKSSANRSLVMKSLMTKKMPQFLGLRAQMSQKGELSKVLGVRNHHQDKDETAQQDISQPQKENRL